mgnify:FL=1
MKKYKICWITSTYLLDVDLPIVPSLQQKNNIDWIILTTSHNHNDDKALIEARGGHNYKLVIDEGIFIHPKKFFFYWKFVKEIKKHNYDLYYFDFIGTPYFIPVVQMLLPKDKCVIAAHNVKTPKGARYYWIAKAYMDYIVKVYRNFQVFSINQLELLKSLNGKANILYAPLCLKDYGLPTVKKEDHPINFLFFGNIVEYKRVDLLIQAIRILEDRGVTNFKVQISGYCRKDKWERKYAPLMKGIENVSVDIRRIPNEEIPNLFERSHYFVMPYQDIAQSGAMTVALFYNIPIIASELDTFKEFMTGENDGYFFQMGSAEQLAITMHKAIDEYSTRYTDLRRCQAILVKEKFSSEAILNQYRQYIDKLCQN